MVLGYLRNFISKCETCGKRLCFFKPQYVKPEVFKGEKEYVPEYEDPNYIVPSDELIHQEFAFYQMNCASGYYYKPYRWNALLEYEKQQFYQRGIETLKAWHNILNKGF